MSLTRNQIARIAHMARLHLPDSELDKYADINQILDLAEKIQQTDTSQLEPMAHPLDINQRTREDKVTETNQRELLQENAKNNVELGIYLVPQVIE
jgi:aspartyl-tRNA(Asn)/glutamyl-tRNA(Gln) amidotransferase subunit C